MARTPKLTKRKIENALKKYEEYCAKKDIPMGSWERFSDMLGVTSRTLYNYRKDPRFSDILDLVETKIKASLEEEAIARSGVKTGVLFVMENNHGYKKAEDDKNKIVIEFKNPHQLEAPKDIIDAQEVNSLPSPS